MISKELLGEVLGIEIKEFNTNPNAWLCVSKVEYFTIGKEYEPITNYKSFGHIIDNTGDTGYLPQSYRDKDGNLAFINYRFLVGNMHELAHKCKVWAYNKLYSLKTYRLGDGWVCECMPMSFNRKQEFDGINSEPEAIFKACQWILDNKDGNK